MVNYVLVTGATSGIGREISIHLSNKGINCIIVGRNKDKLYKTYKSLKGNNHLLFNGDLNDEQFQSTIAMNIPMIDGIVHSAGIIKLAPWRYVNKFDFESIMNINLYSPFFLTQKILKQKKLNEKGSIIFISSISGPVIGSKGNLMYSASKSAVNGIIKTLALELSDKKIRVNSISAGMVRTEMWSEENSGIPIESLNQNSKSYPLGFGIPEDISGIVFFLLDNSSSWITGSTIIADGGFTIQ